MYKKITHRVSSAFTMMEMLVVVMLIGTLLAFIGPRIIKYMAKSEQTKRTLQLQSIKEALNEYRMDLGVYPTEREGLQALIENPRPSDEKYKRRFAKAPFIDKEETIKTATGEPIMYHIPPQVNKKYRTFELIYPGQGDDTSHPDTVDEGQ